MFSDWAVVACEKLLLHTFFSVSLEGSELRLDAIGAKHYYSADMSI